MSESLLHLKASLPHPTLVLTPRCQDPLPVPVDNRGRPTLHDYVKKDKNFAGRNDMASHDADDNEIDDTSKFTQSNPLFGEVLGNRPTISSDVTADD